MALIECVPVESGVCMSLAGCDVRVCVCVRARAQVQLSALLTMSVNYAVPPTSARPL